MIWSELRNDFEDDNGTIFIDAWLTNDGNEEGKVIAKVSKNEEGQVVVDYLDERAKTDPSAQEIIQESIKQFNPDGTTNYIMVWIEEEEKWYYFIDGFDTEQFPNGYVDYCIEVEKGIIVKDTFKHDTIGQPFAECYQQGYWNQTA
jgi:hypothetical protein